MGTASALLGASGAACLCQDQFRRLSHVGIKGTQRALARRTQHVAIVLYGTALCGDKQDLFSSGGTSLVAVGAGNFCETAVTSQCFLLSTGCSRVATLEPIIKFVEFDYAAYPTRFASIGTNNGYQMTLSEETFVCRTHQTLRFETPYPNVSRPEASPFCLKFSGSTVEVELTMLAN